MRRLHLSIATLLAIMLAAVPAAANDIGYSVSGSKLSAVKADGSGTDVQLPCEGTSVARGKKFLYVACGAVGLLRVSIADPLKPAPLDIRLLGGPVTKVFNVGDAAWAEVEGVGRRALDEEAAEPTETKVRVGVTEPPPPDPVIDPQPPPEENEALIAAEEEEEESRPEGIVLTVTDGVALINIGKRDGIKARTIVEFFRAERTGDGDEVFVAAKPGPPVRGQVIAVSESKSKVKLRVNDIVHEGDIVRFAGVGVLPSRRTPPRAEDILELGASLRVFPALGTIGAGLISDLWITKHFEMPFSLGLQIAPAGILFSRDGNGAAASSNLIFGYDGELVGIGAGGGITFLSNVPDTGSTTLGPRNQTEGGITATNMYYARLGARDGTHAGGQFTIIVLDDQFQLGSVEGFGQLTMSLFSYDAWLIGRITAGVTGVGFGELGLRMLMSGNGLSGSTFLVPSVGWGVLGDGVTAKGCGDSSDEFSSNQPCHGPTVGMGIEFRP